jgi:hypothetical protein
MIYPLYDFKKRDNSANSPVLQASEEAREILHNLNKTFYALSSQYGDIIKTGPLSDSLQKIAELHKEANNLLFKPPFVISTLGTTSAGKSTFINSLLGAKLSPMNADELSVGTLKFNHNSQLKSGCRLSVDTLIASRFWENGTFNKTYDQAYDQVKHIMQTYRRELQNETLSPPHISMETAFFAGNNPKFLGLDENAQVEILELPWMVVDSESLNFVSGEVKASMVVFLIDYTVLFNKETRETNLLFTKLMEMKKDVGNKAALLFVLNKVDLRNYDDDELDAALEKCKAEIKAKLNITENIDVIPLNALLMYYVQCAFLAYENGNLKGYSPDVEGNYDETQKMYIEVIKLNLKKCLRDQAKSISEIQDINEANVDLVYEIKRLVQKDKIPSFQLFEKFWKECIKKSGGLKLFEAIREKVRVSLKELILYLPMHRILYESNNFLSLLEGQMVTEKEVDNKKQEDAVEHLQNVYDELKAKVAETRENIQKLLDENLLNLRKPDTKHRKDAIHELDIGQIDETVPTIKKSVAKETIQPVEQGFIEEMRPDNLSNRLIKEHDWDENFAKQLAEHFDFLRVKLFSEKKYIDDGRKFEVADKDQYEKDKIKEINRQMDFFCKNIIQAIDRRLRFEVQTHIDELSVRVNRWLIKKVRELNDQVNEILQKFAADHKLAYHNAAEISSFKYENSFIHKIDLKPSALESKEKSDGGGSRAVVAKKPWYAFWMSDDVTPIRGSAERDVTKYSSVRMQATNWNNSLTKMENDLWNIICDTLNVFFKQALESYDKSSDIMMNQLEDIIRAENNKITDLKNGINTKWDNIDNIYQTGMSLTKYLHGMTGIPEVIKVVEEKDADETDLQQELSEHPGTESAPEAQEEIVHAKQAMYDEGAPVASEQEKVQESAPPVQEVAVEAEEVAPELPEPSSEDDAPIVMPMQYQEESANKAEAEEVTAKD